MLIFTNVGNTYPIHGLKDDIPGVTYIIGRKDCMDQGLFPKYFLETRTFQLDVHNCTSHNITPRLEEKSCI